MSEVVAKVISNLDDCRQWLDGISARSTGNELKKQRLEEQRVVDYVLAGGESRVDEFCKLVKSKFPNVHLPDIPAIQNHQIAPPGLSKSETGAVFEIPSRLDQYINERLRLRVLVALQKALGRKIVVNVGIGYIGTVNIAAAASAMDDRAQPLFFVIGYQRPSTHSSWKVNVLNAGLPTVTTADDSLGDLIQSGVSRGNLTASFIQDQCISAADIIFVETELHVRKFVKRASERAEADPEATLTLLADIAQHMQSAATVVVESTVYPGFNQHDALPVLNRILRQRGELEEQNDANLAYSFHRVKPGEHFVESFYSIPREASAITLQAQNELRHYFDCVGIHYVWQDDITAVELTKDIENAAQYGLLDLMSAFLKAAEVAKVDGFKIVRHIAEARPEEHGRFVNNVAGLQVGGYCVPKELALLINGLRRHFDCSELSIREMFYSRIVSSSISDYRAEDAVFLAMRCLAELGKELNHSQFYWAGVSYKEGVGDTRMAGTERAVRYAAHLGAYNRVTDPFVVNWPELEKQRLGDPECWGHQLQNQEPLRELRVITASKLVDGLTFKDDVVVLAVRHLSYVGASKQGMSSTLADERLLATDPVEIAAKVWGIRDKVIVDCYDFLDDYDMSGFFALGWKVVGFGKGHVGKIAQSLTFNEKIAWQEKLLHRLEQRAKMANDREKNTSHLALSACRAMIQRLHDEQAGAQHLANSQAAWGECYRALMQEVDNVYRDGSPSIAESDNNFLDDLFNLQSQNLFANIKQTGEMLVALAEHAHSMTNTSSQADTIERIKAMRFLKHAGLEGLRQDIDRLVYELMVDDANLDVAKSMRLNRSRDDLKVSSASIEHSLFDSPLAPLAKLRPATVFSCDQSGKLCKLEDPEGLPYRFSTKWVPDHASLLADKSAFPVEWSKFSVEVPINLKKVSEKAVVYELYEDFLYLPLELRHWLVNEVWEKGYVLTTLDGETQNTIGFLMEVNLDSKTVARGRGGVVFWLDTREPVHLTTPEGFEIPLDIKSIGDYRGGSPEDLGINYDRTIISGRVEGGGTARTNLGQVAGHMFSADDIAWQERCKTMGGYKRGLSPRSVFRAQWSYPEKPNETYQMIGRASPSTQRLGHVFVGTNEFDVDPIECAYILGQNNAEVLGHDITAVHIALNLDNVMSNHYYTDMGSNIDLFKERNPKGSFRDYGGYGILMVLYSYAQMKAFEQGRSQKPVPDTRYLSAWFNGFFDHFLSLDNGRLVPNRNVFMSFYDVQSRLEADPEQAEALVDEWLDALWEHYLPYHVLRNRLARGYDASVETPFTTGREERMFDSGSIEKAEAFIRDQIEVLQLAEKIQTDIEKPLDFNFPCAHAELQEKLNVLNAARDSGRETEFSDIYQLSFYPPLEEDVCTILDKGSHDRLVIASARPSVFIDKMEANVSQRMRLAGLRIHKMHQQAVGDCPIVGIFRAYVRIWRGPESHEPGEYDIQQQSDRQALIRLIKKDFQMAKLLNQAAELDLEQLEWLETTIDNGAVNVLFNYQGTETRLTLFDNGEIKAA